MCANPKVDIHIHKCSLLEMRLHTSMEWALQVSGTTHYMRRYDSGEGIIQILHNTDQDTPGQDTWLVVQKQLTNASQV